VVKIEGTPRAQTHPTRNDRWNEEFEISIDKANEVEIALYDRQGNDYPIPIGLLWLRVSDISEALRRRRVGNETGQGWMTAATMPSDGVNTVTPSISSDYNSLVPGGYGAPGGTNNATAYGPADGIDAWFAVEPVGAIALHLDFCECSMQSGGSTLTIAALQ
jgi:classical protein kinase C